jgi:hypothetical protein
MEQDVLQTLAELGSATTPILVLLLSAVGWKYRNSIESRLNQYFEIHKQKVKNSEFFFLKQFEASQSLYQIKKDMLPPYSHPDMGWDDAVALMANDLAKTHKSLRTFLKNYFTVLSPEVLEKLESAAAVAEEGILYGSGDDIREPGNRCADSVFTRVSECTSLLKAEVDGQRLVTFHEFPKKKS